MHLTEVSQRLNIHTDGTVTNQAVELNYSTFCLLACSLYLNKDRSKWDSLLDESSAF